MSVPSSVGIQNQSFHNVFVYGSLLADEVVQVLLKRVPSSSPATLPAHHRFSIKGRVYPAILPVENKKVTGRVLLEISDLELYILDEFEDVEYERSDVDVYLMDNSEKLQALAYIWSNRSDPNLYGDWDFEEKSLAVCLAARWEEAKPHLQPLFFKSNNLLLLPNHKPRFLFA